MPEMTPWKFRKIIKPLFDLQKENIIIKCRIKLKQNLLTKMDLSK